MGWYHTYGMRKTTVYLEERDAIALRRLAQRTGRSQAQIIREAIGAATRDEAGRRSFRSLGAGSGDGEGVGRDADAILRREWPRRKR